MGSEMCIRDSLKDDDLGYRAVQCLDLLEHLFDAYGEKTTKMRAKALEDMVQDIDITGPSLSHLWTRNKELRRFLHGTPEEVTDTVYIANCVKVIENTNFLNKAVLKWDRKPVAEKTPTNMNTFFNAAHKEELKKIAQGTLSLIHI